MSDHKQKSDTILGSEVKKHLQSVGLLTPTIDNGLSHQSKKEQIEQHFTAIMEVLGLDLRDDSLQETPSRVAKMYLNDLFWGLDWDNFPKCTTVENKMSAPNEFVLVKNMEMVSTCEHHFVTIYGKVSIAYIPKDRVMGLSKLARVARFFAANPSVQERTTHQIAEALKFILKTDDVCVHVDAVHYCMRARGVRDSGSSTVTMATSGKFAEDNSTLRREFITNLS